MTMSITIRRPYTKSLSIAYKHSMPYTESVFAPVLPMSREDKFPDNHVNKNKVPTQPTFITPPLTKTPLTNHAQ